MLQNYNIIIQEVYNKKRDVRARVCEHSNKKFNIIILYFF